MQFTRRGYFRTIAGAAAGGLTFGATSPGIPGAYRGRVAAVSHAGCISDGTYRAEPIRAMLNGGMCALTGASHPREAWRRFFSPGDSVGIKVNPVGQPAICSSAELLHAIVGELQAAGVKPGRITVFERYRRNLENSPYPAWIPPGVRSGFAAEAYDPVQMGLTGYDPDQYVELPFTLPGYDVRDKAAIRSHAALFLSRGVDKLINLPVLKSHNAAGVTLALKNLSHGLVNNVSRSHDGPSLRFTEFVPAVVSLPVIRRKTVLNILDGTRALCHGGPGYMEVMAHYLWEHKTLYVATDPVALDAIGRGVIEDRRRELGLWPLAEARTDAIWKAPHRQPEYIESAGQAGLGEWRRERIDLRQVALG